MTALIEASANGHLSIVEVLLDRGADIHHKNNVRWREGGHSLCVYEEGRGQDHLTLSIYVV